MPPFDLRDIEFASDGVSDSLTLTMSPAIFHENLKREIASAKRDGNDLSVLSIRLLPENYQSIEAFEEALIAIAFTLRTKLRGGDFFARISDSGFWVLLRGDVSDKGALLERLDLASHDLESYIVARKYQDATQWIERIDQIHFPSSK